MKNITQRDLHKAVEHKIISPDQADHLFIFLEKHNISNSTYFDFSHLLYYLGGIIAISAMTLFMHLGWKSFEGIGIVIISLLYACFGFKLSTICNYKKLYVPAIICCTFAVTMTPLFVYGIQQSLGIWPSDVPNQGLYKPVGWNWVYIDLATLMVSYIALWRFKYAFLVITMCFSLFFSILDITFMQIETQNQTFRLHSLIAMYFGLFIIATALLSNIICTDQKYAFWLYLFGVFIFWTGLTSLDSEKELHKFLYFCINITMIITGAILSRRVFVLFGAVGSGIYLCHLSSKFFKDSWLFPIALTILGFFTIYLGILWSKHEQNINKKAKKILPKNIQQLLNVSL